MGSSNYDAVIVGSGPGGATAARQMARAGWRVLVLERGLDGDMKPPGANAGFRAMLAATNFHLLGGLASLVCGRTLGGTSMLYYATAWPPPEAIFKPLGVDLSKALSQARSLWPTDVMPQDFSEPTAERLTAAALELGLDWRRLPKLIDPKQLNSGRPRYHAKWNARRFIDQALTHGALLETGARVDRIHHENGRVQAVSYVRGGSRREVRAPVVVLAAGGTGSPLLLRRSGLPIESDFFCDPIQAVFGEMKDHLIGDELAMTSGLLDEKQGFMLADMTLPHSLYAAFTTLSGRLDRLGAWRRTLTVMVKGRDDLGGRITDRGGFRKTFSPKDLDKLNAGYKVAREILEQAGARRIYRSPITAAHPGGAAAIGKVVDANLQTQIKGLYVCDGSVIPGPWGLPPTLTIICLGLKLAADLGCGEKDGRNTEPFH